MNIGKFVIGVAGPDELVRLGSLPEPAARFLEASVAAGLNVLVSGVRQHPGGKTTMLNALCAAIPATERVITQAYQLHGRHRLSTPDPKPKASSSESSMRVIHRSAPKRQSAH